MEALILAISLVISVLLLVAILAASSRRKSVVTVNDQIEIAMDRDRVEQFAFGPLGSIQGAAVTQAVPGQMTLVSKWTPTWAVVIGILSFPVGLLLLLLIRQELVMHVRFLDNGGTTLVQVAGKSRKRVALAVGEALEALARTSPVR